MDIGLDLSMTIDAMRLKIKYLSLLREHYQLLLELRVTADSKSLQRSITVAGLRRPWMGHLRTGCCIQLGVDALIKQPNLTVCPCLRAEDAAEANHRLTICRD